MQAVTDMPAEASPLNLNEVARRTIRAALQQTKGNKVHAAKLLGVSRRSLYRLITRYGLEEKQEEGKGRRSLTRSPAWSMRIVVSLDRRRNMRFFLLLNPERL